MRHLINEENKTEIFSFDSQHQVIEYTKDSLFEVRKESFVGENFNSWDDVRAKAKSCWSEGLATIEDFTRRLIEEEIPEIKSMKRRTEFDWDEGDECDWDRMMQGEAFMRKTHRENSTGATEITVITDTTTACGVPHKDVLWRGAAALALTKILEDKGYSAELWVVNGSNLFSGKSHGVCTACCLKRCSDPLDISTLCNTVAGWFYRSATFTLLQTICDKQGEAIAGGYGHCYSPTMADLDLINRDVNRIYSTGSVSFEGALTKVTHELKRIADNLPMFDQDNDS